MAELCVLSLFYLPVGASTSILYFGSWGKNWGDDGYIHIKKGKNVCGIANMASFPVG